MMAHFRFLPLLILCWLIQPFPAMAHQTPVGSTFANMGTVHGFLAAHKSKKGNYPTSAEGLAATGFPMSKDYDFWGRPFVYRFPGKNNIGSYDLYSLGKDGVSATDGCDPDDINNWDETEPWYDYYRPPSILKIVSIAGGVLLMLLVMWRIRLKSKTRFRTQLPSSV